MSLISPQFPPGFVHYPQFFNQEEQRQLISQVKQAVATAPFYKPTMPGTGHPLSVVMSNFGPLGWVTDKENGYRYEKIHPRTGLPWPALPHLLEELWLKVSGYKYPPEATLINWYRPEMKSKMGMHVDNDENNFDAPVVSVSLGDPAVFRMGGLKRGGSTLPLKLYSGDVIVMGGESRLYHHGISKVFYGESDLVPRGGRINLTMRRVNSVVV